MILGHVRDFMPRILLALPGYGGNSLFFEFIMDTAFDGDLTMPSAMLAQLDASYLRTRILRLADGSHQECPFYQILLDWHGETRETEVTILENSPLIGSTLLDGSVVTLEMTDGGEVSVEPLN